MDKLRRFSHSRGFRQILVVLSLLVISQDVTSREYRTQALRTAAVKLGLEEQIEQIAPGTTSIFAAQNDQTVAVRISDENKVEHIGLPLFNEVMRQQQPSPVYDCVEYAALDRNLLHTENDLLLQKIQLFTGSWQTVSAILPTDECSIGFRYEKVYQVTWTRDGEVIVNMAVPVDYELLMNSSRRELEQNLANDVVKQHVKCFPYHLAEELLQCTEKEGIYVLPGDSFLIKGLTRNTYYTKAVVSQQVDSAAYEEERMSILVDSNYPAETMANLLMSTDPQLPDAAMSLELQLSSNARKTISLTLRQWLSYCDKQGCRAYFIYDDTENAVAKGYLLMRNKGMGYNHLLSLSCTTDELASDTPLFKGKAYLFIPNVEASKLTH